MLGPLLKELEVPAAYTSYIKALKNGSKVARIDNVEELYLGCDAVHVFEDAFYKDLEEEVFAKVKSSETKYSTICMTEELVENCKLLRELTGGLDKVRYSLSGSEAVEVALKDVRMNTNKQWIVRFRNAYHGHTTGATNFDAFDYSGNFI